MAEYITEAALRIADTHLIHLVTEVVTTVAGTILVVRPFIVAVALRSIAEVAIAEGSIVEAATAEVSIGVADIEVDLGAADDFSKRTGLCSGPGQLKIRLRAIPPRMMSSHTREDITLGRAVVNGQSATAHRA